MAGLGICKIKVTGGEPLLRKGMSSFLKQLKTIKGINKVTLTTNGILLGAYLDEIDSMGINDVPDSVNISLDALNSEIYKRITRFPQQELNASCGENLYSQPCMLLPQIDRLLEKQITVKINCVPLRSVNEEEILPIASLAREKNLIIRFIELMPFGSASMFQPVSGTETAALIKKTYGALTPFDDVTGSGPALYYSLQNFKGKIGFINAVTHGFCENCNRLRLTSEGFLKLCLSNDAGIDLREPLRSGANDEVITDIIKNIAAKKPKSHSLSEIYGESKIHPDGLSKIGG